MNIARIVLYTLTEKDATDTNRRRTTGESIAERIKNNSLTGRDLHPDHQLPAMWPRGAQAHIGSPVSAGEIYPLLVTKVISDTVISGQVFFDGNDNLWAFDIPEGTGPGTWAWPVIQK